MGYSLFKPDADQNFYVAWSSETESPAFWGTHTEVLAFTLEVDREKYQYALPRWDAAFDRADQTGTSSYYTSTGWGGDDAWFIFEQRGILQFSDLRAFVDSYDDATGRYDLSYLTPFEDRDEINGYDD